MEIISTITITITTMHGMHIRFVCGLSDYDVWVQHHQICSNMLKYLQISSNMIKYHHQILSRYIIIKYDQISSSHIIKKYHHQIWWNIICLIIIKYAASSQTLRNWLRLISKLLISNWHEIKWRQTFHFYTFEFFNSVVWTILILFLINAKMPEAAAADWETSKTADIANTAWSS